MDCKAKIRGGGGRRDLFYALLTKDFIVKRLAVGEAKQMGTYSQRMKYIHTTNTGRGGKQQACDETDLSFFKEGGPEKSRCRVVQLSLEDLLGLLGLLGQKHGLDVGQHSSLGDGDAGEQLVQLLVVADGELKMTGDDPALLVVAGSVACQLEHLGGQVLHDGRQVDGGSGTNALGVVALPQETVDSAHGELKSGPAAAGLALALGLTSFAASRHDFGEM